MQYPKQHFPQLAFIVLQILMLWVVGCGPNPSKPSADIPGDIPFFARLGTGYDSVTGRFTGEKCVKGVENFIPTAAQANFFTSSDLTFTEISSSTMGRFAAEIPVFPGIAVTGEVNFASEFASSNYNRTFIVQNKYEASVDTMKNATADETLAKAYRLDAGEVAGDHLVPKGEEVCGDHYIQSIVRGIVFVGVMKIEFQNSMDSRRFGGAVGAKLFGGVISGSVDFSNFEQNIRKSTLITVAVNQVGGEPEEILTLLPGPDNAGSGIMTCTLEAFEPCLAIMRDIYGYAKGSLDKQREKMVPLSYQSEPQPPEVKSAFDFKRNVSQFELATLKQYRQKLQQKFLANVQNQQRLKIILKFHTDRLDAQHRALVEGANEITAKNMDFLKSMMAQCWDRPDRCVEVVDRDLANVKEIDHDLLEIDPVGFSEWCELRKIPNALKIAEESTVAALVAFAQSKQPSINDCVAIEAFLDQQKSIALMNMGLSDLGPLAALKKVEELDLRQNHIEDVSPIRLMFGLKRLYLDMNLIESLKPFVANYSGLQEVFLGGNKISDISPLNDLSWSIPNVHLDGNRISGDLPTLNNANILKQLTLSRNAITSIAGLKNLYALEKLYLRGLGAALKNQCPLRAEVCIW